MSYAERIRNATRSAGYTANEILGDEALDFAAKVRLLESMSAFKIGAIADDIQARARMAAGTGEPVGALVWAPGPESTAGLFLGSLRGEDPLTLSNNGLKLLVRSGQIVRVETDRVSSDADPGKPHSAIRATRRIRGPLLDIGEDQLSIYLNPTGFAAEYFNPITWRADDNLAKLEGLNQKIAFQDHGLPKLHRELDRISGDDNLGIISVLGRDLLATMLLVHDQSQQAGFEGQGAKL